MSGPSVPSHLRSWRLAATALACVVALNWYSLLWAVGHWGSLGVSRGESMAPNSDDGDLSFTFKLVYRIREPRRGETVALESPLGDGERWGKRVIGLPGETVEVRGTRVFIDGERLEEPWVRKRWREPTFDKVSLGHDEFYVMGDNRDLSFDSRDVGPIERAHMVAPLLTLSPAGQADPLGVLGVVILAVLIPGAPAACMAAASRAARRRGRRRTWSLAGLLLLGVGVALVLLLPTRGEQTPEDMLRQARRRATGRAVDAAGV